MVLELQVGLVLAVLGLLGLTLLPFERSVHSWPAPWLGAFLGVFLFLAVHDLGDALLLEPVVRSFLGTVSSLSLVATGVLLGGGAAALFLRPREGEEGESDPWFGVLVLTGLVLALHAALDGFTVGSTLQGLQPADVLRPDVVALQVVHRFLEGALFVALLLAAGVRKSRMAAAVLYVGLPFLLTPAPAALGELVTSSLTVLLAFMAFGAFVPLLLAGLWPLLSRRWTDLRAALWVLVGFLVALAAHNLAH